jgi:CHASE2 domain-containing sensor protein
MSYDVKKARRLLLIYILPLIAIYSLVTSLLMISYSQNQEWIFVISTFVTLVVTVVIGKTVRKKASPELR